jgi:uncharacterized membrane protein
MSLLFTFGGTLSQSSVAAAGHRDSARLRERVRHVRDIDGIFAALRALGMARLLALLFLAYGTVGTVLLSLAVPPLQTPDEPMHAMRAAHVADGKLFGEVFDMPTGDGRTFQANGAHVDPALVAAMHPFSVMMFSPERRATPLMWQPPFTWSPGRVHTHVITTMYPPTLYLPQAATIGVGRAAGWGVLDTLTRARIVNGMCAVALSALAIALSGGAAVWLFAVLTLPMSLSGMSTVAPDALLLAFSALAAALAWRGLRGAESRRTLVGIVTLLVLVITTRPAYVGLALVPLALGFAPWRARLAGAAIVLGAGVGWSALMSVIGAPNVGAFQGANPGAQIALLLSEPWRILSVAQETLGQMSVGYAYSFLGVLGWLDTLLPQAYYRNAGLILAVAVVATLLAPRARITWRGGPAWIAGSVLASLGGIFGILYLTWSPVGGPVVHGVQGRYFLPLAMLLAAAVPTLGTARLAPLRRLLVAAVAIFPAYSLGTALSAVIARYYLT